MKPVRPYETRDRARSSIVDFADNKAKYLLQGDVFPLVLSVMAEGGNPYQEILADRGKYIAAALTIARAYLAAGEPQVNGVRLASFGAWSRFVQRPLIWLDRADPAQSVALNEAADQDRGSIGEVLAAWHDCIGDVPVILKSVAFKAQEKAGYDDYGDQFLNPDLREALMNIAPNRDGTLNMKKLSHWLRKNAGKIVGGMKAVQEGRDLHNQKSMWKVVKTKGIY